MSILTDQILADFELADLTEDDVQSIVFAAARKYNWAIVLWSMEDVLTLAEGEDPDDAFIGDGDRPELTEAMRWSVAHTWEWRKGMPDTAAERATEMIPTVVVHADGGYTVVAQSEHTRYNADGSAA